MRTKDILRACILLDAANGIPRNNIATRLGCSYSHICNTIRIFCTHGLEWAIHDRPRSGKKPKLRGKKLVHLIAIACSEPPKGRTIWTMQLLADKCVELTRIFHRFLSQGGKMVHQICSQ